MTDNPYAAPEQDDASPADPPELRVGAMIFTAFLTVMVLSFIHGTLEPFVVPKTAGPTADVFFAALLWLSAMIGVAVVCIARPTSHPVAGTSLGLTCLCLLSAATRFATSPLLVGPILLATPISGWLVAFFISRRTTGNQVS